VNNWIFNPGKHAVHHALVPEEWKPHPYETSRLCSVGNVLEHGPNTKPAVRLFMNYTGSPVEVFMEDNLAFDRDHQPQPLTSDKALVLAKEKPLWPEGLKPIPAAEVKAHVARIVGARPWDRDAIDKRIVDDALAGKGKIIDSEEDAGGYPIQKETHMAFLPEMWLMDSMTPVPPRPNAK
jgi:hypothetical protein